MGRETRSRFHRHARHIVSFSPREEQQVSRVYRRAREAAITSILISAICATGGRIREISNNIQRIHRSFFRVSHSASFSSPDDYIARWIHPRDSLSLFVSVTSGWPGVSLFCPGTYIHARKTCDERKRVAEFFRPAHVVRVTASAMAEKRGTKYLICDRAIS